MKRCTMCGEEKPLDDFHRDKRNKDGRRAYCAKCGTKNAGIWEKLNWARIKIAKNLRRKERRHSDPLQPEKSRLGYLRYAEQNREKERERIRIKGHNRLAKIKGTGGIITDKEWQELKRRYGYACLRCKRKEPEIKLTLDHVKPVEN